MKLLKQILLEITTLYNKERSPIKPTGRKFTFMRFEVLEFEKNENYTGKHLKTPALLNKTDKIWMLTYSKFISYGQTFWGAKLSYDSLPEFAKLSHKIDLSEEKNNTFKSVNDAVTLITTYWSTVPEDFYTIKHLPKTKQKSIKITNIKVRAS